MTSDDLQTQVSQCDTERDVQRMLADWLAGNGFAVFWDRDPPEDYRRFRIANSAKLPDLVAVGAEDTIIIEVKDGNNPAAVYDAMSQTHRYWCHVEQDSENMILEGDDETVVPTAIVAATQYSSFGHLFHKNREQGWRKTYGENDGWWNRGMRPQFEYGRTEAIPRIMWRYAWSDLEENGDARSDVEITLGVLLSSTLDEKPSQSRFGPPQPKILGYNGENEAHWTDIH